MKQKTLFVAFGIVLPVLFLIALGIAVAFTVRNKDIPVTENPTEAIKITVVETTTKAPETTVAEPTTTDYEEEKLFSDVPITK